MAYSVQFVGLVCFFREPGGQQALLPDGRNPGNGIEPHVGSIIIAHEAIEESSGWGELSGEGPVKFPLSPCRIVLDGIETDGALDTSEHDGLLPQLCEIDPRFKIDPALARTVAKIRIRSGKMSARLIPGGFAGITQLDVDHEGPIRITVIPDDGSPERTIVASPGTEIAITNMADGSLYDEPPADEPNHFKIYENLSVNPVTLTPPTTTLPMPRSQSQHVLFRRNMPIGLYVSCINTGCC
jgi:hypothetical protein